MKNADESELAAIASRDAHVYNVADFDVMADIVDVLGRTVCERMETLHKQMTGLRPTVARGHAAGPKDQRACVSAAGRAESAPPTAAVSPPTDLRVSEVTARSFRVTWTPAPGRVDKYRLVYYPASGGQPEEKVADAAPG